jgi:hypothetical protein
MFRNFAEKYKKVEPLVWIGIGLASLFSPNPTFAIPCFVVVLSTVERNVYITAIKCKQD